MYYISSSNRQQQRQQQQQQRQEQKIAVAAAIEAAVAIAAVQQKNRGSRAATFCIPQDSLYPPEKSGLVGFIQLPLQQSYIALNSTQSCPRNVPVTLTLNLFPLETGSTTAPPLKQAILSNERFMNARHKQG